MFRSWDMGVLTLRPTGKIDAENAPRFEAELREMMAENTVQGIRLDCDELAYISSAGLRVVLRLKREVEDTALINVHPELYEILDITGFTELMTVEKAYRVVSLEGCVPLAEGGNGKIYRFDRETIIKVYKNTDALADIHRNRALSRAAFVLGVPTAIPYDVVRIDSGGYGSLYELLNAKTYVQVYRDGEKSLEELARESITLLKLIHSRIVKQDYVPAIRDTALDWAEFLRDYLPAEQFEKLYGLIEAVPDDMHMVHGDYHFRNIMYQDGETLLVDLDKLSHGHPVFELAAMYNAYCAFPATDHSVTMSFFGLPYETTTELWRMLLTLYLGTGDEQTLRSVEDRVKIISYARVMRHMIRQGGLHEDSGRKLIAFCEAGLKELLPRVDTLVF